MAISKEFHIIKNAPLNAKKIRKAKIE